MTTAMNEFTYQDLRGAIDWKFLKRAERVKQLRGRGTRYAGLRGSSVWFRTFSSEYPKNGIIYQQEIKLLDLPEALGMAEMPLKDRVRIAVGGDIAVRCNCLASDVPVPLLDGRERTMEQLLDEYGTDKEFWVYSVDEHGDFVPARARCQGKTGEARELVKITLDDGGTFTCTPDHLVMRRDGSWMLAGELSAGESLMPIYRRQRDKYEDVLLNSTGKWRRTYYRVATIANRKQLRETWKRIKAEGETRIACHHDDENKSNNDPINLRWMGFMEHWMHRDRWTDPEWRAKMVEARRIARELKKTGTANHKVKSVVFVKSDHPTPVYDLEVFDTHNFLIGPGVVVHNCASFTYWGPAFILTQLDAAAPGKVKYAGNADVPERRFPRIRNPRLRGVMCKHLVLVMEVFPGHWNSILRDLRSQGYE